MYKHLILVFALFFVSFNFLIGKIVINEVSSKNELTILDEDFQEHDWIELYNTSDYPISLKNYKIYDKNDIKKAWTLPDTTLAPKQALLIYASEKSRNTSDKWGIDAAGHGITTFTKNDGMHFEYIKHTGDFDISFLVNSFLKQSHFSYVGINLREKLTPESRYAGLFFVPKDFQTARLMYREKENTLPIFKDFSQEVYFPYYKIRLVRTGNVFKACIADDHGFNIQCQEFEIELPQTAYLGIAYSSQNHDVLSKVVVSDLQLNNKKLDISILTGIDFNSKIPGKKYLNNEIHGNFSIKTSGEDIYLWNDKGELVDHLKVPELKPDISYGRFPDGSDNLKYFYPATPSDPNMNDFIDYLDDVRVDNKGGFYEDEVEIELSNEDDEAKIYYTLDGSIPKKDNSFIYDNKPIKIDSTTVVRAIAFKDGFLQSDIRTFTYFINKEFRLPVISLVSDPYFLYDSINGILLEKNRYSEDEIPANFEYWNEESHSPDLNLRNGIKLHGHGAALFESPSLRVYARDEYEDATFDYNFFGERTLDEYKRLVIRNSGQDREYNYFRDALTSVLAQDLGTMITSAYKPISLYINGKYAGLFNIREHMSIKTLAEMLDVSEESINLMEDNFYVNDGSSRTFWEIYDYIDTNDINNIEAYSIIDSKLDIVNTIDYFSSQIFFNNFDWSDHNNKFWMSSELDSKWRWILWDLDWSLGLPNAESNSPKLNNLFNAARDNKENNKLFALFDKLLTNDSIKVQFLNRINDLMNYYYTENRIVTKTDSIAEIIKIEIDEHRIANPNSCILFDEGLIRLKSFAETRPLNLRKSLKEILELDTFATISLNMNFENAGEIEISTIKPDEFPWRGTYFTNIPIKVKVSPKIGYKFVRWGGSINSYDNELIVKLDSNMILEAIFQDENEELPKIVINEIMYKPADDKDCKDWIEIFNNGDEDQDLSGWKLKDDNNEHIFEIEIGTVLKKGEYLVITENTEKFRQIYTDNTIRIIGDFDFGYGRGDEVRLFNKFDDLVDSVRYDVITPWDNGADGTGYSLELINPEFDNTLAQSWKADIKEGGSPGKANDIYLSAPELFLENGMGIYPNPAKEYITINMGGINPTLKRGVEGEVVVEIYDVMGVLIQTTPLETKNFSSLQQRIDISNLATGVYFVKIVGSNGTTSIVEKFVKI